MKLLKLLPAIVLLLCIHGASAQLYIGAHTGLYSGNFSGDAPLKSQYSPKATFTVGLSFDIKLKEDVYLGIYPGYVNAGSTLQFEYLNVEEEEIEYRDSISLDFEVFALPIVMQVISNNQRWQFGGGFEFAIPLSLSADNGETQKDIKNQINDFSFNMLFGLGYRIPIKKSLLVIGLSYSQGLSNIASNLDEPDTELPRVRFSAYRFTVSYKLPVGKNKGE